MKQEKLLINNFEKYFNEISEIVFNYRNNLSDKPVIPSIAYPDLYKELDEEIPCKGTKVDSILKDVNKKIIPNSSKVGHPLFLAWMNNAGSDAGLLGEIINIGINQVPFMYKAGPAATVIEDIVIKWFSKLIGYDENAGGSLVSGGTMANISALLVAREEKGGDIMKKGLWDINKMILYMSEQGHTSIERAAGILGLGSDNIRKIETDKYFGIKTDELKKQINDDLINGYKPFCVVAQGGSASAGVVDPINKIYEICKRYNLWLHVDAAYGGAAILSQNKKSLFDGIENADSITIDPHKWFYIPPEAGMILIKDKKYLHDTFTKSSCKAYKSAEGEKNFLDYGVQTARTSRALKIWFTFKTYGIDKIRECIEQDIFYAHKLKTLLENTPRWEILNPVDLSIICARYLPDSCNDLNEINEFQYRILKELESSGIGFLTSVSFNNKNGIRICFANHRTTIKDVDFLYSTLNSIAVKLDTSNMTE